MFRVINFALLIRAVAIITTVLSIIIYLVTAALLPGHEQGFRIFGLASTIAMVLTLLISTKWSARVIWRFARHFNKSLYPDLNGVWEGKIITEDGSEIAARAIIRQVLLQTEIDMHTPTAKSATLEATPVMERGQYKLYYTFRATPKMVGHGAYIGSTIFDIRMLDGPASQFELTGKYFTDRKTIGRTELRQISDDTNRDISFY